MENVEVEKCERGGRSAARLRRRGAGARGRKLSSGSRGRGLSVEVLALLAGSERTPDGGGERGVNPLSTREMRSSWLAKLSSSSASSAISSGISRIEEL